MTFGMVLLGLILLCSLAGSLIAQNNAHAWYAQTYGRWHSVIFTLGLDDVFGSWYFITLLVLLCLNLSLCSLTRIGRVARASRSAVDSAAKREARELLTEAGVEAVRVHLDGLRCKKQDFGGVTVYSKNHFGWYGSFVTHLAILLTVLFGAAALYLPVITDQTCMPGEFLTMEDGTRIQVDSFHIEDGAGRLDYASEIEVILPGGRSSGRQRISVNYPCSFGGYKVYQQTYGTAGSVLVRNTATGGEDVFTLDEMSFLSLDGVNGMWFEALYPGYLRDEEGNFTLITQTSGAYPDPVYQVLLSSDGVNTPVLAFPGESVTVQGIEYQFLDPIEYPGLRIKSTPSAVNALLCAAFVLMLLGLWLCFFRAPVLVTVTEEGYAVGGPKPQGMELGLELLLDENHRGDDSC